LTDEHFEHWFSQRNPKWDEVIESPRVPAIMGMLDGIKADEMLDLGCRDGILTRLIADKLGIGKPYGADISEDALEMAKKRGIKTFKCDLEERLPFEDDFFDLVFVGEAIEYIYKTDAFIREVHRILKPGGTLIISTQNLTSFWDRIFMLFGWHPPHCEVSIEHYYGRPFVRFDNPARHIHVFSVGAMKHFLTFNKFHIKEIKGDWPIPSLSFWFVVKAKKWVH